MTLATIRRPSGLALLELLVAVLIISIVAALSLQPLRPATRSVAPRACDATRQSLQRQADEYFSDTGKWPSGSLAELMASGYLGGEIPHCPQCGGSYQMSGAIVICPVHEATRR
ncbi:MAG: prepilin-type N-terminal cleavage/methylation domain-containing protein [Planctomycetaceae bacterium]